MRKDKRGIWYSAVAVVLIIFALIVSIDFLREKPSAFPSGTAVRESSLPGYRYEISDGAYSANFKDYISKDNAVKFSRGSVEISFRPVEMRYVSSQRYLQPISSIQKIPATVEGNKIIFKDAFAGVDFVYEYNSSTLKEKIIFTDRKALFTPDKRILADNPELELQFLFDFRNSDLIIGNEVWDKISLKRTNGALNFRNFKLDPTFLKDGNGVVTELKYEIKRSGSGLYFTVKIPYSLIQDAAYPLEVDPSITILPDLGFPDELSESLPALPANARFTKFSMIICDDARGICNEQIFNRQIAVKNVQGVYRPFREVVKVTTNSNILKIEWKSKSISFAPYMMHGNKKYRKKAPGEFSLTSDIPAEVALKSKHKDKQFSYKYDLGFSNLGNYKTNLREAGLEVIDVKGFSKNDIQVTENSIILPDEGSDFIEFSWQDAIDAGFDVQLSKDRIYAVNVANQDTLLIDPVVGAAATEDVYTDYSLIPTTLDHVAYIKFPITGIPAGSTLNTAFLVLQATAIDTGGAVLRSYNCSTEWTEASTYATVAGLPCSTTGNSTNVSVTGFYFWNVSEAVRDAFAAGKRNLTIKVNSTFDSTTDVLTDSNTILRAGRVGVGGG